MEKKPIINEECECGCGRKGNSDSDSPVRDYSEEEGVTFGATTYNFLSDECYAILEDELGGSSDFCSMHPDETAEDFAAHEDPLK